MSGSRYNFRLERVRSLRERREDQAKQVYAVAFQARQRASEHAERASERVTQARAAQLSAAVADLAAYQRYLERMEHAHHLALEELRQLEDTLAQRRAELTRASQNREALERLKEKGLAQYLHEAARVEQNLLDEIAGNGFWRRAA